MFSGSDKLANPVTKSAMGVLIEPTRLIFERFSMIKVIKVIPQARKSNDSYKLLNGKYPKFIQRSASKINNEKFAKTFPYELAVEKIFMFG